MASGADAARSRWSWAVPLLALAAALALLVVNPLPLQVLRNAAFDQFQRWSPREDGPLQVLVVDIDDDSLARLGQWPWPRTRLAALLDELAEAKVAAVALDIVLAEPDRTSPRQLALDAAMPAALRSGLAALPDHDEAFAAALSRAPSVIGFALKQGPPAAAPLAHAGMLTLGATPDRLPAFGAAVTSLPILQRAAAGEGAITFTPDADGVIRRVPMLARLGDRLVPSLSAEALRLASGATDYRLRVADDGAVTGLAIGPHALPVDEQAGVWVHFGRQRADRYLPAWKLLAHQIPADALQGRIVLVGTSAQGLLDLRFSPLGGIVPGVEVHAQAIEQTLSGQSPSRPAWALGAEGLACVLGGLLVAAIAMTRGAAVSTVAFVGLVAAVGAGAWLAFTRGDLLLDPTAPALALLLVFLPTTVLRHLLSERRQRWVRQAFARYVSPNLVDYLIAHPGALALGGKRQRCSFVFTDLAGFTSLMETMEPQVAVGILNDYLDRMIAIAFEHEGTLDRIVGDAVAIVFSAPVEQADHEARAVRCALAMHRFAKAHLAELQARGVAFCATRIGVHSGEVTVGNFGGHAIFDYRALGDPVNTASRLEGANKHLGTLVCVSEATLAGCPEAPVRPIGRLRLAGRSEALMAYELLDGPSPVPGYDAAYAAIAQGRDAALAAFEALAESHAGDPLVRLHLQRLRGGLHGDVVELAGK